MSKASRETTVRLPSRWTCAARRGHGRGRGHAARSWAAAVATSVVLGLGVVVVLVAGVVGAPGVALAQENRTAFLVTRLKGDDLRVRTQAALALGGTNDDNALAPLCDALDDDSDVVRQAVAAALKRLNRPASLSCLKGHLGSEKSATVRLQLSRAIEAIDASSSSDSASDGKPKNIPDARYYVSVSPITNNTGRPNGEIEKLVGGAIRAKLEALGTHQVAPTGEGLAAAKAVIAKRKLRGYYLAVSVDKFDYDGGNLRVKVKVAVFSYPGKDLRGEVPAGLTQQGVSPGDRSSEDNLMGLAAERAVTLFAQNFP